MSPMVAIQIRDVPDDLHAELRQEAEDAGQSLNKYLLSVLRYRIPPNNNAEIFARAAARTDNPPPGTATRIITAMRDAIDGVELP